jgi:integrase/recombinase XerD
LEGTTEPKFTQFIKERKYLSNVSSRTIEWYEQSLSWLNTASPTDADLKSVVIAMRQKGLKATGCKCRGRAINAYLKWTGSALRIPKMKEPQFLAPTFTAEQVRKLIGWKPVGRCQQRLHLLVLILLDTGCRISEALDVHVADCDLDNLLMTLNGKGRKQRKVPFSFELRSPRSPWCLV